MQSKTDISTLVRLLDDPDESVYNLVRYELLTGGTSSLHGLEKLRYDEGLSASAVSRIDEIIEEIHFEHLKNQIDVWESDKNPKLIDGISLVIRFRYKNFTTQNLNEELQRFASPIWLEVGENFTALEKIQIINRFLFSELKIKCSLSEDCMPGTFFVNDVLLNRIGNDLSITAVYLLICEFLEMPVGCVKVFSKFVLGYQNPLAMINPDKFPDMMFYINPANRGLVMGGEQVQNATREHSKSTVSKSSYSQLVKAMFCQLAGSYKRKGQLVKAERCEHLANHLKAEI